MEYVEYLELSEDEEGPEMQCLLKDRLDPISYFDDHEFRECFIFHEASIASLTDMLKGDLAIEGDRGRNAILQVLIALRFYADGSVHRTGDRTFG